ncbi:hypothetical protein SeLEV6574_g05538 [Synchytrium endobioticum]|uniref:Uncharacterized protein n=1 Tax=Synchytrium endobioticum TaxID=286115 RepID=A0A507CTU7_9FUNG|nr:hypothetical protein SeLEV6574_g05538 [Synchytrium endobioticum]
MYPQSTAAPLYASASASAPRQQAYPSPTMGPAGAYDEQRRAKRLMRGRPTSARGMDGLRTVDASLGASNIRIANRRVVATNLLHCLALDVRLTCFALHLKSNKLATCAGTVTFIWDLHSLDIVAKLGKGNAIHKDTIRHVCFDVPGIFLATCGDDRRIAIWNVHKQKTERIIEHHLGPVYQVAFIGLDGLVSCSEDGTAVIWDVHTGAKVMDFMRHPAAVRCLAIQPMHPERILTGCNDGTTTAWDVNRQDVVDVILSDPTWSDVAANPSIAWNDESAHHAGGVICMAISPSSVLLATGSLDHTCKLWSIASYLKSPATVADDRIREREVADSLGLCVNVGDEETDCQAPKPSGKFKDGLPVMQADSKEFRVGEVPLSSGYHADLLFTFRHEAPVLSVTFNIDSNIVVTGAADSTCRLWSARRGDLLFQINTPAPVTSIHVDETDRLFCICQSRLMVFQFHASSKPEVELEAHEKPVEALHLLHRQQKKQEIVDSQVVDPPTIEDALATSQNDPQEMDDMEEDDSMLEPARLPPQPQIIVTEPTINTPAPRKMSLADIRRLVSHGITLQTFVDSLIEENHEDFNKEQLEKNLKAYNLPPKKLLRAIINHSFAPGHILKALSTKRGAELLQGMIQQESSISSQMMRLGFKPLDEWRMIEEENSGETPMSPQSLLSAPSHGAPTRDPRLLEPFARGIRGRTPSMSPRLSRSSSVDPSHSPSNIIHYSIGRSSKSTRQSVPSTRHSRMHNEYAPSYETYDEEDEWEYVDDDSESHPAYHHDPPQHHVVPDDEGVPYEEYWNKMPKRVKRAVGARIGGKVVHFLPSEQLKLIKDAKAHRLIRPVFRNNLVLQTAVAALFPNFGPDAEIQDQRPAHVRHPAVYQPRLNETTGYKKLGIENFIKRYNERISRPRFISHTGPLPLPLLTSTRRQDAYVPHPPATHPPAMTGRHFPLRLVHNGKLHQQKWQGSGSILFPERYLQSTGLNVEFGGSTRNGTVRVQQVVMRNGGQYGVGSQQQYGVRFAT